ncbi:MAG TPA: hypothetical protein VJ692_10825 [Nitrospiraceae bacterium]|nr:hypothetical protein [Nitrospiraceae bacterium]
MNTSWLSGRVQGEGEVTDSRPSTQGASDNGNMLQYRLIRFGLTGMQHGLKYGVSYRVAGEGFSTTIQDQGTREVWGEWNSGIVRLRTAVTERWNNLDRDPRRPRVSGTQNKTTLAIAFPAWPELSVSYARDSLWSSLEPIGVAAQRNLMNSVEAAVSFVKMKWTARLLSTYSVNIDQLREDGETVGLMHALSGSYRPTERITIAPSVSLRADQQRWTGVRLDTPSASVLLSYAPNSVFKMTAFGLYSKTRSTDGLMDSSTSKMSSVFTWICRDTPKLHTTVSFDASYSSMLDAIQPAHPIEDLSGLLRLQVAGL